MKNIKNLEIFGDHLGYLTGKMYKKKKFVIVEKNMWSTKSLIHLRFNIVILENESKNKVKNLRVSDKN
jgi:hypothetical protein